MSGRFRVEGWNLRAGAVAFLLVLSLAIPISGATDTGEEIAAEEKPAKADEPAEAEAPAAPAERCRPAPRFQTLEDIFGDTGDFFQAGVGIINFEKADADAPDPASGYGVGVDDMVIEWREFNLVADTTTCAGNGECAVIDLATSTLYEGNTLVSITVIEKTPPADNDCDFDDVPDGTTDCDSNGVRDVPVRATSEVEIAGEFVACNLVSGSTGHFTADLPISNLYDVDGVLFLQPVGTDLPTVTVLYMDNDDGTGSICKNDVDPAAQGRVEATTVVGLTRAHIVLVGTALSDNGDNDGWADSNETVQMQVKLANNTEIDLSGLTVFLATNDPKIECITNTTINFGDLPARDALLSTGFFEFKVADVSRPGSELDDFSAEFNVIVAGNEFDATVAPQTLTLDLDLDATGGTLPGSYFEGFESGDYGTFTTMNIDAGKSSEVASEGYRCQYSDPDWHQSNSYGEIDDCWLAASPAQSNDYFWRVYDNLEATAYQDARSKTGRYSASMSYYHPTGLQWTTPMAIVEAMATHNAINIGWDKVCENDRTIPCTGDGDCSGVGGTCVGVTPELAFWQQANFQDSRVISTPNGESGDGGAVTVQLADPAGVPVGDWIKIEAYQNVYDQQRTDNYTNCFFDPIDDGNTEDDFFDPGDPERRLGPSTLCFPEFSFVNLGDTGEPFAGADQNLGRAEGPGAPSASGGLGTWVQSKFNLNRFRGRSLRMRFVNGSLKAGGVETVYDIFPDLINEFADDGWWIDDVSISDTLTTPATITVDTTDNSALPGCGSNCTTASATMVADPPTTLPAPGQVVELDASASTADACLAGTLQFQFWAGASLVRSWTDNPILVIAPLGTTTYTVDVRCSTATTCVDSFNLDVIVDCPTTGLYSRELGVFSLDNPDPFYQVGWIEAFGGYCSDNEEEFCTVDADCDAGTCLPAAAGELLLSWPPGPDKGRRVLITRVEVGEDLEALKAYGQLVPIYSFELQEGIGFRDPTSPPPPGSFNWYLITHDDPMCNVGGSWQTGTGTEPGRDVDLP